MGEALRRLYSVMTTRRLTWEASLFVMCAAYGVIGGVLVEAGWVVLIVYPAAVFAGGYVLGLLLRALLAWISSSDLGEEVKLLFMMIPVLLLIQMIVTMAVSIGMIAWGGMDDARAHLMAFGGQVYSRPVCHEV